jgi:hypothetical protein
VCDAEQSDVEDRLHPADVAGEQVRAVGPEFPGRKEYVIDRRLAREQPLNRRSIRHVGHTSPQAVGSAKRLPPRSDINAPRIAS